MNVHLRSFSTIFRGRKVQGKEPKTSRCLFQTGDMMSGKNKVLFLGVDGGTFRIIKPGIKAGRLPTFQKLIQNGVSGILRSTIPPATIPAFPTLMTGKNPGKHGVFSFLSGMGKHVVLSNASKMIGKTLWRILSDHNRQSLVINVPLTYPPEPINGVIVSGMLTPMGRNFTHPPELAETLNELTQGYPVRFDPALALAKPEQFVKELHEIIQKRRVTIFHLLENWDWNFFAVLFGATDIVQHILWWNEEEVLRVYEHIDTILGEILNRYPEAHVFIFSDHGAGPYQKLFNLNLVLKSLGLLSITAAAHPRTKSANQTRPSRLETVFQKLGLTRARIRNLLPAPLFSPFRRLFGTSLTRYLPQSDLQVDVKQSKAYYLKRVVAETPCVQINEPNPQKYKQLVSQLTKQLLALVDSDTGNPIVKAIYHRDELYRGPFVENAPDLLLLLHEGYKGSAHLSGNQVLERLAKPKGTHTMEGIFLAMGPHIQQSQEISDITLQDLTPTILHVMGIPIPDDVDGKVKKGLFTPQSPPAQRKPKYYKARVKSIQKHRLTQAEEEEVKDRLRSLGYLD